jgi:hypothetical protein
MFFETKYTWCLMCIIIIGGGVAPTLLNSLKVNLLWKIVGSWKYNIVNELLLCLKNIYIIFGKYVIFAYLFIFLKEKGLRRYVTFDEPFNF